MISLTFDAPSFYVKFIQAVVCPCVLLQRVSGLNASFRVVYKLSQLNVYIFTSSRQFSRVGPEVDVDRAIAIIVIALISPPFSRDTPLL